MKEPWTENDWDKIPMTEDNPPTGNIRHVDPHEDMCIVANELVSLEWEEFQLSLGSLRAALARTKRELSESVDLAAKKEVIVNDLNKQLLDLNEQVGELKLESKKQKITAEHLQHRINELVTHVEQRDYQIAKLSNRRAIKIADALGKLKRKIVHMTSSG